MEKIYKPFDHSFKERQVKLYRTVVNNFSGNEQPKSFDILVFDYMFGGHEVYIKYPNLDYFIEMVGCTSSMSGDAGELNVKDAWYTGEYKSEIKMYYEDDNMFVNFRPGSLNFSFCKLIHTSLGIIKNYDEINNALSKEYLKIPDSVRKIQYAYKSGDVDPTYYIVDASEFNFCYDTCRFFILDSRYNETEYKITNFERYRDGGTTYITISDCDTEHILYAPTPFAKNIPSTFDNNELVKLTEDEIEIIIEKLGIETLKNRV